MGPLAFYVVAHQDDWQLFHGQQAWLDIGPPDNTIVLIYLTAGDAGRTDGWWEAREAGAMESCRLATGASPLIHSIRNHNGHPIATYVCRNTVSYFLRISEGAFDQLRVNNTPAAAIDGSTTYASRADLTATLRDILETHRHDVGTDHPWVNAPDYDTNTNPGDNPLHVFTGSLAEEASRNNYNRLWFVGYDCTQRPANLQDYETERKRMLFVAYSNKILEITTAAGHPHDDYNEPSARAAYESWFPKDYFRGDGG